MTDRHEPPSPASLKNAPKDLAKPPLTGCFSASDLFSIKKPQFANFRVERIIIRPRPLIGQIKPFSEPAAWKLNGWRETRKIGRRKVSPQPLRNLKDIGYYRGKSAQDGGMPARVRYCKTILEEEATVGTGQLLPEGMKIIRAASTATPVISTTERPARF